MLCIVAKKCVNIKIFGGILFVVTIRIIVLIARIVISKIAITSRVFVAADFLKMMDPNKKIGCKIIKYPIFTNVWCENGLNIGCVMLNIKYVNSEILTDSM